jgi:hypothetical protein
MSPNNTNFPLGTRSFGPDGFIWQLNGTNSNKKWVKTQFTRKDSEGGLFGRGAWDTSGYIDWTKIDNDGTATEQIDGKLDEATNITIGPLKGSSPTTSNTTARYPSDALIDSSSDYVFFQFGKYIPPFSREANKVKNLSEYKARRFSQAAYNASTQLESKSIPVNGGKIDGVVLPMPQDLGNDLQQTWNGKQFSALGRSAIAAGAGGNFSLIGRQIADADGNITAAVASLQTALLNKIPGAGGNIDVGDITGSTRGIVLNPNAEVLYESAELREIGMTFKMIPRSAAEAKIIKNIVYMFRFASVPAFGGNEDAEFEDSKGKEITFGKENFIRVPYLCKFTFMSGNEVNNNLQQFKPCAIRKVAVNYTSDGTYATYSGGEPVATELTLNFLESKLLFKSDIKAGF